MSSLNNDNDPTRAVPYDYKNPSRIIINDNSGPSRTTIYDDPSSSSGKRKFDIKEIDDKTRHAETLWKRRKGVFDTTVDLKEACNGEQTEAITSSQMREPYGDGKPSEDSVVNHYIVPMEEDKEEGNWWEKHRELETFVLEEFIIEFMNNLKVEREDFNGKESQN